MPKVRGTQQVPCTNPFGRERVIDSSRYKITSQNADALQDTAFEVKIEQGTSVTDSRLGKGAYFEKRSAGAISKQELLILTRRKLAADARTEAKGMRDERSKKAKSAFPIVALLLVFAVFVGTVAVRYFAHRKAAA